MKRYGVIELRRYESSNDLKRDYYESQRPEVRMGILHALLRGSYHVDQFPVSWRLAFFLRVCRESISEAEQLSTLNQQTPHAEFGTSHDEVMRIITKKNKWISRSSDLSKMASMALEYPMKAYINKRREAFDGLETEVDKAAEEVLALVSCWEFASHFSFKKGSRGRLIEKFLGLYISHRPAKEIPDNWFRAVIHSKSFDVFQNHCAPSNRVQQHLVAHLKEVAARNGITEPEKLTLSAISASNIFSPRVISLLVKNLHRSGALDSIVDLNN